MSRNDRGRPADAPDTNLTGSDDTPRARQTPLQSSTAALFGVLANAREDLDERSWQSFIEIACNRIGHEAARLVAAEAMRATGEEHEAA